MTYATLAKVKRILAIEDSDDDIEITECITTADAMVDNYVMAKGKGLRPGASPGQNVIDGSSFYAAWLFRRPRDPTSADAFLKEAEKCLDLWIAAQNYNDVRVRLG